LKLSNTYVLRILDGFYTSNLRHDEMPNLSKMKWRGGAKSLYHLKSYENAQQLHSLHQ
jgi:hypothetical protein